MKNRKPDFKKVLATAIVNGAIRFKTISFAGQVMISMDPANQMVNVLCTEY
jgi:hypothetical protein